MVGRIGQVLGIVVVAVALPGCIMGGDNGGFIPPAGTVERVTVDGERAYLLHKADAYDKIADQIEGGKVFTIDEAISELDKSEHKDFIADMKPLNSILNKAAEKNKYGLREEKVFRAISRGIRQFAGKQSKDKE